MYKLTIHYADATKMTLEFMSYGAARSAWLMRESQYGINVVLLHSPKGKLMLYYSIE